MVKWAYSTMKGSAIMKYRLVSLLLVLVLLLSACAESGSDRRRRDDDDDEDIKWAENREDVPEKPMQVQTIQFQREYGEDKEYAVITALDADGETVWKLETQHYHVAQLDSVTEIGMWNDRFYYVEGGTIVALNRETGEMLWENREFRGHPAGKDACLILENGTIVATGFFSPDLAVVDKDGNMLAYLGTYDEDIYWPYEVVMEDDMIVITFEGTPDGSGEVKLTVDPETWEVTE